MATEQHDADGPAGESDSYNPGFGSIKFSLPLKAWILEIPGPGTSLSLGTSLGPERLWVVCHGLVSKVAFLSLFFVLFLF